MFNYFSERKNATILYEPSLGEITICDVCGSYECGIKGSNPLCSQIWPALSSSYNPSSATRGCEPGHMRTELILSLLLMKTVSYSFL